MRIMTWNVNGIKTLLQYSPWNALKSYENILNKLDADVICFQETKITKKQVDRTMAVLPSFDSFFSSYSRKPEKGYSGTCIFTRRSSCIPVRAEEGISGLLASERRPELASEELIGGTLTTDTIALNMQDVRTIDLEGRTTMVDLGLFVLINCYFPNETNEERLDFKLAFNSMFEARVLSLIRAGRQVIALGDINISATPLDHCDPVRRAAESSYGGFEYHPARKWFNEFIGPKGSMVDLGRHFHPERRSMFTHWETRINARETNYGSRIDYILATPGLLRWIKSCDIQPHILGSDHCPVVAEFYDTITTGSGKVVHLWDLINPPGRSRSPDAIPPDPPRMAARFYTEFGSEQRLLSNFFSKPSTNRTSHRSDGKAGTPPIAIVASPTIQSQSAQPRLAASKAPSASAPVPASIAVPFLNSEPHPDADRDPFSSLPLASVSGNTPPQSPSIDLTSALSDDDTIFAKQDKGCTSTPTSPPAVVASHNGLAKLTQKKAKKGQQTLGTFFKPPTPAPAPSLASVLENDQSFQSQAERYKGTAVDAQNLVTSNLDRESDPTELIRRPAEVLACEATMIADEDEDLEELRSKAINGLRKRKKRKQSPDIDQDEEDEMRKLLEGSSVNKGDATLAWSSIFTAKVPPLCTSHAEPCKQWTVNKSGPNKGRAFWLCARPVGEGYDKGQNKADVNPEYRCNYFKWESDIKRAAPSSSAGAGAGSARKKKKLTPGHG